MTEAKRKERRVDLAIRNEARRLLSIVLPRWNPIRVRAQWKPDEILAPDYWTFRVEREHSGEVVLEVRFEDIPKDTRPLVLALLKLLDEHALLLDVTGEVALVELGTTRKRGRGATEGGQAQKLKAEKENAALVAEAEELLSRNSRLSIAGAAQIIGDRARGSLDPVIRGLAKQPTAIAKRLQRQRVKRTK
jgi:hypothetical protein